MKPVLMGLSVWNNAMRAKKETIAERKWV